MGRKRKDKNKKFERGRERGGIEREDNGEAKAESRL